jgi:cytochrome c oxidase subunit IV
MLAVAVVKATLVVLIFMHMIEQPFATRMVMVVSVLFVILLIALTAGDIATRTTFPAGVQAPDAPASPEDVTTE